MVVSARFAGWSSIAGAILGIVTTPFMAAVWAYEIGVVWSTKPAVTRVFGPILESWGALTFGSEDLPYKLYGKAFVFVYVLMLPIVRYIHVLQNKSATNAWERKTWRVLWIVLIVAAIGDGVSYWGVSLPGPLGDSLWGGGFMVEIIAMLVVLASTTIYGIVSIRIRAIPVWAAALLTGIIPIGVASLAGLTSYIPNAVVVPMSIVWATVGVWVLVRQTGRPVSHSEPAPVRP